MHTIVFDIGKTNKKAFVFDQNYKQVYRDYERFAPVEDEDGHPTDDLRAITDWLQRTFDKLMQKDDLEIEAVNFSTYGATLVHLDRSGQPLTPLYNYTKPYPVELLNEFYEAYGDKESIELKTGSPQSGMLNSGLQLFWLKKKRPEVYEKTRFSLHFPQYLSYLFTGIAVNDYTSIGCHTSLWDYNKQDYHEWVYKEEVDRVLPPIVSSGTSINVQHQGKNIRVGVGIHDSSAALIPYIRSEKKSFLLISTGTWSISLNPFTRDPFSQKEIEDDCLYYMRIDGHPVKASRVFLGNEYKLQVEYLCSKFDVEYGYHRSVAFDEEIYARETKRDFNLFHFESLQIRRDQPDHSRLDAFTSFEEAFHRLMIELMEIQLNSSRQAIGNADIKKIYIDGGFADNDIFVNLAIRKFKDYKLRTTKSPLGSSLGAAMVISDQKIKSKFLKKHYAMRKHKPMIVSQ